MVQDCTKPAFPRAIPPRYARFLLIAQSGLFHVLSGIPKQTENGYPNGPEKGPKMTPERVLEPRTQKFGPGNSNSKLELELDRRT